MASNPLASPFRLGAYLGNPDNSSLANQALFDAKYTSFNQLIGAPPALLDYYIDQSQLISQWVGNSNWEADSASQSANAKGAVPVIALPMASTGNPAMTADAYYLGFVSGQYDAVLTGIVQTWANDGFTTQYYRPGWEMNLSSMPFYAGDDAKTQADWVAAFQHISTVLHQAGTADGVNVQVVWNPSIINYTNANATVNLYPGSSYVDVIAADIYADMYPYNPLYDWNKHDGTIDASLNQWMADPVNRTHYWTYPAATPYSLDGSTGHSLSLLDLIQFAKAQGKPIAIAETGAGNSDHGRDVADDAAFPQWLAQTLQASGVPVAFVNLWDSNGGGNYEFSLPADNKPAESAAWAKYFGASSTVTLGSGSDTLAISISEDAWNGNAQFTVSIDGAQIGGLQTAVASHGAAQTQIFNVLGSFATGGHTATVNFLNDAWGGSPSTDRNLYVDNAALDGTVMPGGSLTLMAGGPKSFGFSSTTDTLMLRISEDAWNGDAQYTVSVDGTQVGGTRTAHVAHSSGSDEQVALTGQWGGGTHTVTVAFINDAWGGTAATDRNLYLDGLTYDGNAAANSTHAFMPNGAVSFVVGGSVAAGNLVLHLSEDAYQGDAQFQLTLDGQALGGTGVVTALHSAGKLEDFAFSGIAAGAHQLGVTFTNDLYAGTPATDRNLYVGSIDYAGHNIPGAALMSTGTKTFTIG